MHLAEPGRGLRRFLSAAQLICPALAERQRLLHAPAPAAALPRGGCAQVGGGSLAEVVEQRRERAELRRLAGAAEARAADDEREIVGHANVGANRDAGGQPRVAHRVDLSLQRQAEEPEDRRAGAAEQLQQRTIRACRLAERRVRRRHRAHHRAGGKTARQERPS